MITPPFEYPRHLPGKYRARRSGFSLIELMIVVAAVAILVGIAYPSYQQAVMRANRGKAISALSKAASEQERFLFSFGRYAKNLSGPRTSDPDTSGLGVPVDTEGSGTSAYYTLNLLECQPASPLCYRLQAEPKGSLQSRDRCGMLELDSTGRRTANRDGSAVTGCW